MFPTIQKKITEKDRENLLLDADWVSELRSKLNIPSGGGASGGGISNLSSFTTDDLTEGTTNLYSLWKSQVGTYNYLTPKDTTRSLIIGDISGDGFTAIESIGAARALFIDNSGGGTNFFFNHSAGAGFPFGGIFASLRSAGTANTPTAVTAGDFLGGFASLGYDGTSYSGSGATHLLPGIWSVVRGVVSGGVVEHKMSIGGLLTPMISWESDTDIIRLNDAQVGTGSTISYWDSGAAWTVNHSTGITTVHIGLNMSSQLINNVLDPVSAQDAATKNYVDATINNFDIKLAVRAASQGNLAFSRSGNVYTATALGLLLKATIDSGWVTGAVLAVGDRLLLTSQTSDVDDGIVTITDLGSVGTNAVLTRSTDMDVSAEITSEMRVPVSEGTDANIDYHLSAAGPFTINVTSLPFTKAGGPPTGTAAGDLAGTYPNPTIKSSVALSGSPTTTTQAINDNSTKIATTAYADTNTSIGETIALMSGMALN